MSIWDNLVEGATNFATSPFRLAGNAVKMQLNATQIAWDVAAGDNQRLATDMREMNTSMANGGIAAFEMLTPANATMTSYMRSCAIKD